MLLEMVGGVALILCLVCGGAVRRVSPVVKLGLAFWLYLSCLGCAIFRMGDGNPALYLVEAILGMATIWLAEMVSSLPCGAQSKAAITAALAAVAAVVLLCAARWLMAVALVMLTLVFVRGKMTTATRLCGVSVWLAACAACCMGVNADALTLMPVACIGIGAVVARGKAVRR